MRFLKNVTPLLLLTFVAVLPFGAARADESNKLTIFNFSAPVELPGLTLPAGSYTFKLMDNSSDRNIVQVFNKDMTKYYGTFLGISDYRPEPSEKTIIRFSESASGASNAIKEWFYPGDNFGVEFAYPRARARELAKASNTAVPSMPDAMKTNITKEAKSSTAPSVTALKSAELKAQEPNGNEVEVSQGFTTAPTNNSSSNAKHHVNSEGATSE